MGNKIFLVLGLTDATDFFGLEFIHGHYEETEEENI